MKNLNCKKKSCGAKNPVFANKTKVLFEQSATPLVDIGPSALQYQIIYNKTEYNYIFTGPQMIGF